MHRDKTWIPNIPHPYHPLTLKHLTNPGFAIALSFRRTVHVINTHPHRQPLKDPKDEVSSNNTGGEPCLGQCREVSRPHPFNPASSTLLAGRCRGDIKYQPTLTPTEACPRKNWVTLLVLGVNVGPSLSCSSKKMVHYSVLHRVYTVHIFARDHGSPSHSTPAEIGQPRRSPVGSAIKQCAERCGSGSSVWNLSKVDSEWDIV